MCCTEPAEHARRRKLLNLVFTEQSLKAANPIIIDHINSWLEFISVSAVEADSDYKDDIAGWSPP